MPFGYFGMLLKRGTRNGERRTSEGNGKIKKWEQNRELPMKLLIGIGVKISFFPHFFITSFHELVLGPRCPVPRFNNSSREEKKLREDCFADTNERRTVTIQRKTIRSFIAFTYSLLKWNDLTWRYPFCLWTVVISSHITDKEVEIYRFPRLTA